MPKNKLELERDPTWRSFSNNSYEYFEMLSERVKFLPLVSDDIVKRFEAVKKLLKYSYAEYEFLDIAFERALSSFELALKIRYFEIEKVVMKKKLVHLINWANSKSLFEDSKSKIEIIRKLRNEVVAYPKQFSFFGITCLDMIFSIIEIINGLYDDVELRKSRKSEHKNVNRKLKILLEKGSILTTNTEKIIIFHAELLFFNNKLLPNIYHFLFFPIFDPNEKDDQVKISKPFLFNAAKWYEKDSEIIIESHHYEKIQLRKIEKPSNQSKYDKWKSDFNKSNFPLREIIRHEIGQCKFQIRQASNEN